MKTIKERADECTYANHSFCKKAYIEGATEQREIDIENCVKWCENFNKDAEKIGCEKRIDVESFRQWITNMIMSNGND